MEIEYTRRFERAYEKLSDDVKRRAKFADSIFRTDPFDVRLRAHKLHGKLAGFWSLRVDVRHRIIFHFLDNGLALFHMIGSHPVYDV